MCVFVLWTSCLRAKIHYYYMWPFAKKLYHGWTSTMTSSNEISWKLPTPKWTAGCAPVWHYHSFTNTSVSGAGRRLSSSLVCHSISVFRFDLLHRRKCTLTHVCVSKHPFVQPRIFFGRGQSVTSFVTDFLLTAENWYKAPVKILASLFWGRHDFFSFILALLLQTSRAFLVWTLSVWEIFLCWLISRCSL